MTDTYASITLSGAERNAERLGLFVAWLVSNHLLDKVFEKRAGSAVARVRLQDQTGPEFLTTVLHGELKPSHLNETGRGFVERYYLSGDYDEDFAKSEYKGDNEWARYEEVSPWITAAYRRFTDPKPKIASKVAKILQFPGPKRS